MQNSVNEKENIPSETISPHFAKSSLLLCKITGVLRTQVHRHMQLAHAVLSNLVRLTYASGFQG